MVGTMLSSPNLTVSKAFQLTPSKVKCDNALQNISNTFPDKHLTMFTCTVEASGG